MRKAIRLGKSVVAPCGVVLPLAVTLPGPGMEHPYVSASLTMNADFGVPDRTNCDFSHFGHFCTCLIARK